MGIETMEAQPVDTRKSREYKAVKRIAKVGAVGGLTLTALFGPGLLAGWRNARADQDRLERAESALISNKTSAATATNAYNNFVGRVSTECTSNLRTFLHDGKNATFSNGEAQIIIQQSKTCEGSPIDLVSQARELDKEQLQTLNAVQRLEHKIPGLRHDAENNYELFQGATAGVGVEAIVVLGIATIALIGG